MPIAALSRAATAPVRTITAIVCPSGILPCTNPTQIVERDRGQGERGEQRHQQRERALDADDRGVADDDAEQQDRDDDLQAVHGQLVHRLAHLALAGHTTATSEGDGDADQPGGDQRGRAPT